MASQSDARMFLEMAARMDKLEELMTKVADEIQRLVAQREGEQDLMPVMYPGPVEDKDAA